MHTAVASVASIKFVCVATLALNPSGQKEPTKPRRTAAASAIDASSFPFIQHGPAPRNHYYYYHRSYYYYYYYPTTTQQRVLATLNEYCDCEESELLNIRRKKSIFSPILFGFTSQFLFVNHRSDLLQRSNIRHIS
jgi:hypothetical protein